MLVRDLLLLFQVVGGRVSRLVRVEELQDLIKLAVLEEIRGDHLEADAVTEKRLEKTTRRNNSDDTF